MGVWEGGLGGGFVGGGGDGGRGCGGSRCVGGGEIGVVEGMVWERIRKGRMRSLGGERREGGTGQRRKRVDGMGESGRLMEWERWNRAIEGWVCWGGACWLYDIDMECCCERL